MSGHSTVQPLTRSIHAAFGAAFGAATRAMRAWISRLRPGSRHPPVVRVPDASPVTREVILIAGALAGAVSPTGDALVSTLEQAGYAVRSAADLDDALASVRQTRPVAIILRNPAGPRTCAALRNATDSPILALLAQPSETDIEQALDAGADDCQAASIGAPEALWRVRALLRRRPRAGSPAR
jgi:CheY-like chemotaxis protein